MGVPLALPGAWVWFLALICRAPPVAAIVSAPSTEAVFLVSIQLTSTAAATPTAPPLPPDLELDLLLAESVLSPALGTLWLPALSVTALLLLVWSPACLSDFLPFLSSPWALALTSASPVAARRAS